VSAGSGGGCLKLIESAIVGAEGQAIEIALTHS
jgi:hypothetical protein